MTLRDLHDLTTRLLQTHHSMTDTNLEFGAVCVAGAIEFEVDASDLHEEISDLIKSKEHLKKQLADAEDREAASDERAEKAEALLDEVSAEDEAGTTLRQYAERAAAADEHAKKWRDGYVATLAECNALRKRKGVTVNLFKCEREILRLLVLVEGYPSKAVEHSVEAKELYEKLHAK